jgi:integrase
LPLPRSARAPLEGHARLPKGHIQASLGHRSPKTTSVYTHLTREVLASATDPVNRLMQGL